MVCEHVRPRVATLQSKFKAKRARDVIRVSHACCLYSFNIRVHIGASIITYIILGVPYYNYGILGTKTLF